MGKVILQRIRRTQPQEGKVIKVGADVYSRLSSISADTGLSIQRLSTLLLDKVLDEVVVVDSDEGDCQNDA